MKTTYFIDNESIKRTAKAIQKENPTFKYTIILDDLSKILGYDSYNQYEHYLTNIVLSKDTSLNRLKVLTKIDSIKLLLLKNEFKSDLESKGYSINGLHFINKIIENQKKAFLEHSYLSLYAYMHYLPLVYLNSEAIDEKYITNLKYESIQPIINLVKSEYEIMGIEAIHELVKEITLSEDYSLDETLYEKFNALNKNLKTRGIYYYIKSIVEEFEYDEGLLTGMILKGYSTDKIEHALNVKLKKLQSTEKEIPVFFKEDMLSKTYEFFPMIKNSVTELNPIMLGRNPDLTPFLANSDYLRSNIYLLGLPGCGNSPWLYSMMFQFLMNNRGFCVIDLMSETPMKSYIEKMANSLNKKNDIFTFTRGFNTKLLATSIHNEKLVVLNCGTESEHRRKVDVYKLANDYFEQAIKEISEYFFTAKFRNKKIPYYITILNDPYSLKDINDETKKIIKKLNSLNIYFIFESYTHSESINELCDLVLVPTGCLNHYSTNESFEFSQLMKEIKSKPEIIGTGGPSKKLPAVFSVIYKNEFKGQAITEFDEQLFDHL